MAPLTPLIAKSSREPLWANIVRVLLLFLIPAIAGVPIIVFSKSLKICFFHFSLPSLELILNKYPFVLTNIYKIRNTMGLARKGFCHQYFDQYLFANVF